MLTNFRDENQKILFQTLSELFNNFDVPFYVGGSRYFGYADYDSDLDVFIYLSPAQQIYFRERLGYLEFTPCINTRYEYEIFEKLQLQHEQSKIQITILKKNIFYPLEVMHRKIKRKIDDDQSIIPAIKELKKIGMKGEGIYKYLKCHFRL